jgi:hypothetical protein
MRNLTKWIIECAVLGILASPVQANLISVAYVDTKNQCNDPIERLDLTEEFGLQPPFANNERLEVNILTPQPDCGIRVGGGDDFRVQITNRTGRKLFDLFVAADSGVTFANFDGQIAGNRAKFLLKELADAASFEFDLLDSRMGGAAALPTFGSLGVPSDAAASTYSIVGNVDKSRISVSEPGTLALLSIGILVLLRYIPRP